MTQDLSKALETAKRPYKQLQKMDADKRCQEGLKLHMAGYTWDEIASQLAYKNALSAKSTLMKYVRGRGRDIADEWRALEMEKLRHMGKVLWPRIEANDDAAMALYLRVSERMAKLLGADIVKSEVTHKGQPTAQTIVMVGGNSEVEYLGSLAEYRKRLQASKEAAPEDVIDVAAE